MNDFFLASKTAVELVDCVHDWLTFDKETPTEFALEQLRVLAECISECLNGLRTICSVYNSLFRPRNY